MSEFDLIRRYFSAVGPPRADVISGVGDDCALLRLPSNVELAVSIDTLVSGVHFLPDADPQGLGHKALAVGLSDLAAMGAEPAWATLALTLPAADETWLAAFSQGFSRLAVRYGVALVGGDTTRGPLSLSVQVHGLVPRGQALGRHGARPGDLVWVSGTLGDAGLALHLCRARRPLSEFLCARLERPSPRVALGLALRGLATAAIDLSDGLAADLGHLLRASGVGAEIRLADLPRSTAVRDHLDTCADWDLVLSSGDDYELCFCVPGPARERIHELGDRLGVRVSLIGHILPGGGLRCVDEGGAIRRPQTGGYDHFPGLEGQ